MANISKNKKTEPLHPPEKDNSAERKQAESDALFLSIGEGAIVTNSKGNISRVNKKALSSLGFKAHEVLGKWYPDTIIAEDEAGNRIPNIERPILEVFLSGKTVFSKLYYRKNDGSRIAVALTVSPVLLDNKPIGAIEVFRDITEEVKLERAKEEFIALASHQLRTPATGVKQYAGMLLDGFAGKLTNPQVSMVKNIYKSNERQIDIINDLLRVAQIDAGQVQLSKRRTALIMLVQDVINEQKHKFKNRSQQLQLNHPKEEVWAVIDSQRMRMVLENIIDNASKYTPERKKISITISDTEQEVYIEIKDAGVGIAQKDIQQIFVKFTRLDNPLSMEVGGTGLGLYWVKKLLDLHGATLNVKSKPGRGTSFIIRIPHERKSKA